MHQSSKIPSNVNPVYLHGNKHIFDSEPRTELPNHNAYIMLKIPNQNKKTFPLNYSFC